MDRLSRITGKVIFLVSVRFETINNTDTTRWANLSFFTNSRLIARSIILRAA